MHRLIAASKVIFVVMLTLMSAWAATERPLHNFGLTNNDGSDPQAGLIFDHAGNLYGTTYSGGSLADGTVFEMTPNGSGGWTEKVLHNFGISDTDGTIPQSDLVFDGSGNLYGTTNTGGSYGDGTVFELTPNGRGGWIEKVIHNFGRGRDGTRPQAGLVLDNVGNLYGTTYAGGTQGEGTVFEVSPNGHGGWTERVIHNFGISDNDGEKPAADLIFDSSNNLYGTTMGGGSLGSGTVFEMSPDGAGGWTERVLHNCGITIRDGKIPQAGLVFDSLGNLYGTTSAGGTNNGGTVFELSPNGSGGWAGKTLHNFGFGFDGVAAYGLVFDPAGNLYGTTAEGGNNNAGVAFEMTPSGSGTWTERVLHNFGTGNDGAFPQAGLVIDGAGNLYGTTGGGGIQGDGTVFVVTH
jgi:uncharacterized repeat protein (TIGR03803 family)